MRRRRKKQLNLNIKWEQMMTKKTKKKMEKKKNFGNISYIYRRLERGVIDLGFERERASVVVLCLSI
jgi:hypothetical protein